MFVAFFCIVKVADVKPIATGNSSISVPIQQVGRVFSQDLQIPDDVKETFTELHTEADWRTLYNPTISDPLMPTNDSPPLSLDMLSAYIKLGIMHPKTYFAAYTDLTYPFWQFGAKSQDERKNYASQVFVMNQDVTDGNNRLIDICIIDECRNSFVEQSLAPLNDVQRTILTAPKKLVEDWHIPIISDLFKYVFFNISLPFYVLAVVIVVSLLKKRYWLIIVSLPVWAVLLSLLLFAPVASMRYSLHIYYVLPLLILILLSSNKVSIKKRGVQ
jgi:hypothetical protein